MKLKRDSPIYKKCDLCSTQTVDNDSLKLVSDQLNLDMWLCLPHRRMLTDSLEATLEMIEACP
jgi:hypothetical protein